MFFRVTAAKALLGSKIPFGSLVVVVFQNRAFLELDSAIEKSFPPREKSSQSHWRICETWGGLSRKIDACEERQYA